MFSYVVIFTLILRPTLLTKLDLSSDDWFIESHIPEPELDGILNIIARPHRTEVRKTKRLTLNGTVPGYAITDLYQNGIIGRFISLS